MTTTVVNVRSPEWAAALAAGTAVYIGRPCRGFGASPFGNPWKVGHKTGLKRGEAVQRYREWAYGNREHPTGLAFPHELLETLRGKVLGCWCKPDACHGDVLVRLLDEVRAAVDAGREGEGR